MLFFVYFQYFLTYSHLKTLKYLCLIKLRVIQQLVFLDNIKLIMYNTISCLIDLSNPHTNNKGFNYLDIRTNHLSYSFFALKYL